MSAFNPLEWLYSVHPMLLELLPIWLMLFNFLGIVVIWKINERRWK